MSMFIEPLEQLVPSVIQVKRLSRLHDPFRLLVSEFACEHNITSDKHQVRRLWKLGVEGASQVRSRLSFSCFLVF